MIYLAIAIYAVAMVTANLFVWQFGPWVAPMNAFFLIGLDLSMRDWLHTRIRPAQMLVLIGATGCLTYLINPAALDIAVGSVAAFMAAALADWGVFTAAKGSWIRRSNVSNVVGAAVDSVVFPAIAFHGIPLEVVAPMFLAKVSGGAVWSLLLSKVRAA
jgi:hypothetical protein